VTALHDAVYAVAKIIADKQPAEYEIEELIRGCAGKLDIYVRELMREKRRAVWIEPRQGMHGQVIDEKCRMKAIDYVVKRKGD
jgi:hypothetical protein